MWLSVLSLGACWIGGACTESTLVASQLSLPHEKPEGFTPDENDEGGQSSMGLPVESNPDPAPGQEGTPACVRYVDNRGSAPVRDGRTWESALATVQEGIDAAFQDAPCQVWVAQGTYPIPGSAPSDTLQLRPGVAVYGGFAGREVRLSERDVSGRPTILDGESRVRHVVTGCDESELNGLVITRGQAKGSDLDGNGGGMINLDCSPKVVQCVFRSNHADGSGGAIFNRNGSPQLERCTFMGNDAGKQGGALGNLKASPAVRACRFDGNQAGDLGGAVYLSGGNPLFTNGLFVRNASGIQGGALASWDGAVPTLINCTFTRNKTFLSGGALIISGNSAASVTNSIFWADTPTEFNIFPNNQFKVSFSDVQGLGAQGTNLNQDPLLDEADGFRLGASSPAIDVGDGSQAPQFDLDGNPRVDIPSRPNAGYGASTFVDLGAFEFQGPP